MEIAHKRPGASPHDEHETSHNDIPPYNTNSSRSHDDDQQQQQQQSDEPPAPPLALSPEATAVLNALPCASTPYLTCSRCNSVTFVNLLRVRSRAHEKDETRLGDYEQLPICTGCGSTKYLRAGVVSFQEKIEDEKNAIKEFERKRVPATALIQRIARGFLGRVEYRKRKIARERYLRKINRSATRIQTRVRGMQARRRSVIERCLRLIKNMHVSVLVYALAARPDKPPVFWYENPAERSIFFWNYREFVRRSGGKPTLIKVETNVLEITRRMLIREFVLVSRIQSCWRSITTRLVFREFKRQKGWLRGIQQSPAIKVQRLFRGHTSRKQCRALKVTIQYPSQLEAYRQARLDQQQHAKRKAFRSKLLGKYRLEYQVDKTTRMMALQVTTASSKPRIGQETHGMDDEIGPETHSHVHHSLKTGSTTTAATASQGARIGRPNQRGDGIDNTLSSVCEDADDSDEQHRTGLVRKNRNANSQRFAEIKSKLEGKKKCHRIRDPRLHILKAQQYAPSAAPPSKRTDS